jgi:oxygen-dependent protoporphyrinogen oxidase
MGLLTNETTPMPWDDVYAMTTPGLSFNMFFNHANPLRTGPRAAGGSLMVYAGGTDAEKLLTLSDEEITKRFVEDLEALYPETKGIVEELHVKRWPIGNSYRKPGADFKGMLDYCRGRGHAVHFAGDYFSHLGSVDRAAASGVDAARRVREELSSQVR